MYEKRRMHKVFIYTAQITYGKADCRLMEISVIRMEGNREMERFHSLVNPGRPLPLKYVAMHTIDNKTIAKAPSFCDIAHRLIAFFKDALIVGYDIKPMYGTIRKEFKRIGYDFKCERLCLKSLSNKICPNIGHITFEKLTDYFSVYIEDKLRVIEGAEVVRDSYDKLVRINRKIDLDVAGNTYAYASLPEQITADSVQRIPNSPGVYFFKDENGTIIYVGKAKCLRKRIMAHFNSKAPKELELVNETCELDFVETGSELVALLMESSEISLNKPRYNRAQIIPARPWQIVYRKDAKGLLRILPQKKVYQDQAITYYSNRKSVIERLEQLCLDFSLCPKLTGLQRTKDFCTNPRFTCQGICRGNEGKEHYNSRVKKALDSLNYRKSFAIIERGRNGTESSFVMIKNGFYHGIGFIEHSNMIQTLEDLDAFLQTYPNSYHTTQIVDSYLRSTKNKILVQPR